MSMILIIPNIHNFVVYAIFIKGTIVSIFRLHIYKKDGKIETKALNQQVVNHNGFEISHCY